MSILSKKSFQISLDFVRHLFIAGNEHAVHSPFVFKLLTEGIYKKERNSAFEKIEDIRKELLKNTTEVAITDLGAGSAFNGMPKIRTVSEITGNFAKSPRYGRLLFHITEFLKPSVMIELGTSLGISAMYQSSGNPSGKLYTLEGCNQTADFARSNFKKAGYSNVECITGNFDKTFQEVLEQNGKVDYIFIDGNHTYEATKNYFLKSKPYLNENAVLVFDDINWSNGMKKAWKEIKSDPEVTLTLDFFFVGLVFISKNFTKQDIRLRL